MIYYFCLYMYQQSPKIDVQKYEYNKIIVEVQKYMIRHIFSCFWTKWQHSTIVVNEWLITRLISKRGCLPEFIGIGWIITNLHRRYM